MAFTFNDSNADYFRRDAYPGGGTGAYPTTIACFLRFPTTAYTINQQKRAFGLFEPTNATGAEFSIGGFGGGGGTLTAIRATYSGSGGTLTVTDTAALNDAAWHSVVFAVTNGSTRAVYVDGAALTIGASNQSNWLAKSAVGIGVRLNSGSFAFPFLGDVANCAVWNAALTASEAAQYAKGLIPALIQPNTLTFYAPLHGLTNEQDWLGSTLTRTGSPVKTDGPRIFAPRPRFAFPKQPAPTTNRRRRFLMCG